LQHKILSHVSLQQLHQKKTRVGPTCGAPIVNLLAILVQRKMQYHPSSLTRCFLHELQSPNL
jgi:hypothetical protein